MLKTETKKAELIGQLFPVGWMVHKDPKKCGDGGRVGASFVHSGLYGESIVRSDFYGILIGLFTSPRDSHLGIAPIQYVLGECLQDFGPLSESHVYRLPSWSLGRWRHSKGSSGLT